MDNKLIIGINKETQFYNEFFTEFDLSIIGSKVLFKKDKLSLDYSISYVY